MFIRAFLAVFLTFLVVDAVWISLVLLDVYRATLGSLIDEAAPGVDAALFYIAYAAGIVQLAVRPAVDKQSMPTALINGAILGALAYGTYTVTNNILFDVWTVGLVVSDILWGSFLTAVCAAAGFLAGRRAVGNA